MYIPMFANDSSVLKSITKLHRDKKNRNTGH